ncbi:PucR family transcriptional regulator [Nocardiopsis potens]|uniref:PucR family transcriptional regulator n=1 Tax=Nocardiopsis potens TaxID=1246458 RepID=UPI000346E6BB|nr:PucR family transcriptional regulator [Nocardiopsis potens]
MPPTLGAVLRIPRLGLRLRAGGDDAGARRVRWVAISELTDPTPYLEGGELVLTTGIRWPEEPGRDAALSYVRRLADRGAAGLGFGVEVAHDDIPAPLLEAAGEVGLPLIEVPRPTPFMAVGKAVSRLLAEEEYEGLTRAFDAQRRLTQAALRGEAAVVERLATELARAAARAGREAGAPEPGAGGPGGAAPEAAAEESGAGGWVLLLDQDGRPRHAVPPAAAERADGLAGEVRRLRASKRPAGASVAAHGETVAVQALGVAGRVRGFLAIGAAHRFGPDERTLVSAAASLLSLELEHRDPAGGDLVGGLVEALLEGGLDLAGADRLRAALPAPPLVVAVAEAPPEDAAAPLPAVAGDCLAARLPARAEPEPAARRASGGGGRRTRIAVLGPESADPAGVLAGLTGGPVGASRPAPLPGLPAARAEAERALEAARGEGAAVVRAAELPGGFLGLVGGPAGTRIAGEVLAPLTGRRSAADLLASLRAYLAASGRWDAAAESIGVHRHTLRYRINRIRELLPGDLDDPDYRTELWLALRTLERDRG